MSKPSQESKDKKQRPLKEGEKRFLVTAGVVGAVLFNVAVTVFQIVKAKKK